MTDTDRRVTRAHVLALRYKVLFSSKLPGPAPPIRSLAQQTFEECEERPTYAKVRILLNRYADKYVQK